MTYVSIAMTLKEKPSLPNASHLSLHVRRMRGQVGATSRPWWRFACHDGAVHHQHFHPDQTITKQYYIEVIRRLRDALRKNGHRCGKVVTGRFITTMLLPIPQLSCRLFWQNITSPRLSAPYSPHFTSPMTVSPPTAHISHHPWLSAPLQP